MNLHPQNLVIFLTTLAIAPAVYGSQASSYSALSSASSSSVGAGRSDKTNSGAASSTSSSVNAQPNATQIALIQRFRKLGDACLSKNPQQAIRYYEQAEKLGSSNALNALGYLFLTGAGNITRDYKRAFDYLTKAAAQGNSDALANLGSMYHKGVGVTQDFKRAIDYYEQAVAKKNATALYNLSSLYRARKETPRDIKLDLDCLEQAAQAGLLIAQRDLGKMYFYGLETRKNLRKALAWILVAANKNHHDAQVFPYPFLQEGICIRRDTKKAAEFFEKIKKEVGSEQAARKLIMMKYHGIKPPEPRFPLPCAGEKCTICTSSFALDDEITVLPCNHCFCEQCITPWISKYGTCPTCHQKTTLEQCEIRITSAKA